MTPEAQRIAIAEACGWTEIWSADKLYGKPPDGGSAIYVVPDYLHDLNACHEMEKMIPEDQRYRYGWMICEVVLKDASDPEPSFKEYSNGWCADYDATTKVISATATQRCEAFLRTLGLWREPSS